MTRRNAFTIVEVVIAAGLLALLIAAVSGALSWAGASSARLTPQMALQQQSRKALVQMLRELQESIEVISPRPGCTLSYALVRDKISQVRFYYQIPSADGKSSELWRYGDGPTIDAAKRDELLLTGVHRLAFTTRSEGALQINLVLGEGDQETALLTSVRLRNIAAAEEIW